MSAPQYFIIGETMYHADLIEELTLDGGPFGHGCWGTIRLKGWPESQIIGDGSYAKDGKHVEHLVVPEFDFKTLRAIMRGAIEKPWFRIPDAA